MGGMRDLTDSFMIDLQNNQPKLVGDIQVDETMWSHTLAMYEALDLTKHQI